MMAIGSVMIATSAERTCQRKTRQTSATTMLSSISFSRSVCDGAFDQLAAVVSRTRFARLRAAMALISVELLFDAIDDVERILAVAHDDDAADDFALAVQFRHAAPDVRRRDAPCRHSSRRRACRSRP